MAARAASPLLALGLLAALGCQPAPAPPQVASRPAAGPPPRVLARVPRGPEAPVGAALALALRAPGAGAPGPARALQALPASWDTAILSLSHPTALTAPRTATLAKGLELTDNGAGGYLAASPFGGAALRPATGYTLSVALYEGGGNGLLVAGKALGLDLVGGANAVTVTLDLVGLCEGAPFRATEAESGQTMPAIAAGPSEALLTWVDDRALVRPDLYARRVATDGTLAGADAAVTGPLSLAQGLPHLAFDPGRARFLVTWEDGAPGPDIHAQLTGADGTPQGGPLTLGQALLGDLRAPRVAYVPAGDYFAAVWSDHTGPNANVVGQAVRGDGTLWGANNAVMMGAGDQDTPDLAHAAASDRTLVVWRDAGGPTVRIRGRLYTGADIPGGAPFDIGADVVAMGAPAVAADPVTGEFLVAYVAQAAPHQIRARRVSPQGALGPERIVEAAGGDKASPRLAYVPWRERFLVAWQVDADPGAAVDQDLHARYLTRDGSGSGARFVLAGGPGDQTRPELAPQAGGDRVLASFADRTPLGAQRVFVQRVQ